MAEKQTDTTKLAVIANDIAYMKNDIHDIKTNVSQGYVTKDEFEPIKKIVYGLVAIILVGVVGALLSLVVIR